MHVPGADQLRGFKERLVPNIYPTDFAWTPLVEDALVSYVDDKVGELLDELEAMGLADNTAVLFLSDHGEMLGEKGMIQKRHFYEHSARVPMILRLPPAWRDGRTGVRRRDLVSLIDVFPTLLDLAGVNESLPVDGTSLLQDDGDAGSAERAIFAEYHSAGVKTPCFMAVRGPWKYAYFHGHGEQLFNLEEDPDEWHDLAGERRCQSVKEALQGAILRRFQPDVIMEQVVASKQKRWVIREAMKRNGVDWSYRPPS